MPITNISKTAGAASMECGGAVDINLAVAAAPGAATQRVAIALILDRSGSMAGTPMLHLKAGAKEFVNIITDANAQSGGSMYEMGLISFAAEATTDVPLTGNIQTLNAAIEGLEAKGNTNQAGAFQQAGAMLQGFDGKKVAVMFTDGMPTVGGDPAPQADELKAGGVEIFCIGLRGSDGLDEDTLRAWVSPPPEDHVLLAPTASELEEAFEALARELLEAGARNVVVRDILGPQFTVLSVELGRGAGRAHRGVAHGRTGGQRPTDSRAAHCGPAHGRGKRKPCAERGGHAYRGRRRKHAVCPPYRVCRLR